MHVECSRTPYSVYYIYLKDVEEKGVSIVPRITMMRLFQSTGKVCSMNLFNKHCTSQHQSIITSSCFKCIISEGFQILSQNLVLLILISVSTTIELNSLLPRHIIPSPLSIPFFNALITFFRRTTGCRIITGISFLDRCALFGYLSIFRHDEFLKSNRIA